MLLTGCNGSTAPVDDNYESLPADQVAYGIEHITTVSGVRRANLHADTTLLFNDSSVTQLRGVELELYNETGTHRATLTSESGELNRSTNAMVARGNVVLVVHGQQGRTVWTEELHYDPTEGRIWSDVATRSRTASGQEIRGDSFTSDDEFSNFRIRGGSGTGFDLGF